MVEFLASKAGVGYGAKAAGTITDTDDVDLLLEGAIAAFDSAGKLIASDAYKVDGDSIQFCVKRGSDVKWSRPYYKDNFSASYSAYVAPVAKIMAIGSNTDGGTTYNLNLPSTLTVGKDATIYLIDLSLPHDHVNRMKAVTVAVKEGDTAATFMTRLMARFNKEQSLVTMSEIDVTNHDGFLFTAKTAGKNFMITCGGLLENADVLEKTRIVHAGTAGVTTGTVGALTNLADLVIPQGSITDMFEAQKEGSIREGNNVHSTMFDNSLYTAETMLVADETYDQFVISGAVPNDNNLFKRPAHVRTLTIAVPNADANVAIIQNIVNVFITPGEAPAG